jgi:hypothetical protein
VEAVGAAFTLAEAGATVSGGRTTPPNITVRGTKKGGKGGKKGQKRHPRRLTATVNNSNTGMEIENSDKEFIVVAEHDFKRRTRSPKDHFKKILEAAYPHHPYPIKHKLKDCTMMRRFLSSVGTPLDGDELARDPRGRGTVLMEAVAATIIS